MRKLVACLSLVVVVAVVDPLGAQEARQNSSVEKRYTAGLAYRPQRPRMRPEKTQADLLIHQKAVAQARQRTARIEARKWHGHSPLRPAPTAGAFAHDVNTLAVSPWGAYVGPWWAMSR